MRIGDIMTPVETIEPGASIQRAAERMRDLDVGALPVCDGDRLVGMITDRDIAVRATADGIDPHRCRVEDAMTREMHYCLADDDVAEAAELMKAKQIRRLPVLDQDHRLVGTVSLGDLAMVLGSQDSGRTLEQISKQA